MEEYQLKEFEDTYRESQMYYKTFQALVQKIKFSDEEIDELIKYFEEKENYEYCDRLRKLK